MASVFQSLSIDEIIPGELDHVSTKAHSVAVRRQKVTTYPQGAQSITATAASAPGLDFNIIDKSASGFLDLNTAVLHFTLSATVAGGGVAVLDGMGATKVLQNCRVIIGGQKASETQQFADIACDMTGIAEMSSSKYKREYAAMARATKFNSEIVDISGGYGSNQSLALAMSQPAANVAGGVDVAIPLGYFFKFFANPKFLPVRNLGQMLVHFDLNNAAFALKGFTPRLVGYGTAASTDDCFVAAAISNYTMSNIRMTCDSLQLDATYLSAFDTLCMSDEGVVYPYEYEVIQKSSYTPSSNNNVPINAPVSELTAVYLAKTNNTNYTDSSKPLALLGEYNTCQFQLGSLLVPQQPTIGSAQIAELLSQAAGKQYIDVNGGLYGINFNRSSLIFQNAYVDTSLNLASATVVGYPLKKVESEGVVLRNGIPSSSTNGIFFLKWADTVTSGVRAPDAYYCLIRAVGVVKIAGGNVQVMM